MVNSGCLGLQAPVFVRGATGLRKEAGALDVFVSTNNHNIGLGVAFVGLAIG
jgi:hypothetical protein